MDTYLLDIRLFNGQSGNMRDWQPNQQDREDQHLKRSLRLEAWSICITLGVLLLVMARELLT